MDKVMIKIFRLISQKWLQLLNPKEKVTLNEAVSFFQLIEAL